MIPLQVAHVDWLTLTTFGAKAAAAWLPETPGGILEPAKRLQYEGVQWSSESGSLFMGNGEQKGRPHWMTQASGYYSQSVVDYAVIRKETRAWRCTRIDLAITAEQPSQWTQTWLWAALRADSSKRAVSYVSSLSGPNQRELATVYIGSRKSRRFVRVYEKPTDKGIAIRFEVEYKGDRAREVWRMLRAGEPVRAILAAEVIRLGCEELAALYAPGLHGLVTFPVVRREEGDTERWLVHTVLPALERYLNSHSGRLAAERVRQEFLDVLSYNT